MKVSLARRSVAEFFGTAFLVAAVVGSGVMGDRLSGGNVALALLANTVATGAALVALIFAFGPISGAHLNPVVTVVDAFEGGLPWSETPYYVIGQTFGAISGAAMAHIMFGLPLVSLSRHARGGGAQVFSEFVATFGLVSVIWGCSRLRSDAVPFGSVPTLRRPIGSRHRRHSQIPQSPSHDALATRSRAFAPAMSPGSWPLSSWEERERHSCSAG
jgi:glycerol uptake facilitator-like aquaporin